MAKLMCRTNPEIEPGSPSLQADSLSYELQESSFLSHNEHIVKGSAFEH